MWPDIMSEEIFSDGRRSMTSNSRDDMHFSLPLSPCVLKVIWTKLTVKQFSYYVTSAMHDVAGNTDSNSEDYKNL